MSQIRTASLVYRAVLAHNDGDRQGLEALFNGPDGGLLAEGLLLIARDQFVQRLGEELWQQATQDAAVVAEAAAVMEGALTSG